MRNAASGRLDMRKQCSRVGLTGRNTSRSCEKRLLTDSWQRNGESQMYVNAKGCELYSSHDFTRMGSDILGRVFQTSASDFCIVGRNPHSGNFYLTNLKTGVCMGIAAPITGRFISDNVVEVIIGS